MRYLLDTDGLLDLIGGYPDPTRTVAELRPHGLGVSIVSHGELFEGAFGFPDTDARISELYVFLNQFETVYLTDPIMEVFGRTRSELRRSGRGIQDFDLLIGATAVHHDLILLTRNVKHFDRIPGLRIYQPNPGDRP